MRGLCWRALGGVLRRALGGLCAVWVPAGCVAARAADPECPAVPVSRTAARQASAAARATASTASGRRGCQRPRIGRPGSGSPAVVRRAGPGLTRRPCAAGECGAGPVGSETVCRRAGRVPKATVLPAGAPAGPSPDRRPGVSRDRHGASTGNRRSRSGNSCLRRWGEPAAVPPAGASCNRTGVLRGIGRQALKVNISELGEESDESSRVAWRGRHSP